MHFQWYRNARAYFRLKPKPSQVRPKWCCIRREARPKTWVVLTGNACEIEPTTRVCLGQPRLPLLVIISYMYRLSTAKRAQILSLLVEGMSMRSITRVVGVSINTVATLLQDAGEACAAYHDEKVKGIRGSRRVECDELWSYVYAKRRALPTAKSAPEGAGDVWTWTAIDYISKLIISYFVSNDQGIGSATAFMKDLRSRLEDPPQIYTDTLPAYPAAVYRAFGPRVDFLQVVRQHDRTYTVKQKGSTLAVERHNLTMRMSIRRFARLTNAFSKSFDRHIAMLNLYFVYYNFCRIHSTLGVTPAMKAGITKTTYDCEWIVGLVDARTAALKPKPEEEEPLSEEEFEAFLDEVLASA